MKPGEDRLRALLLQAGTTEHYEDPVLYDHEYRRRRRDVHYYRDLAKGLAAGRPLRVLELGCGSGRLLVPLVKDGHTVVGVDRSRPMLGRCQERIRRLAPTRRARAALVLADFRDLPFSQEGPRFPLIVCPFNAFQHLYTREDVERCLAAVRVQLGEGGLFALDVLMPDVTWLSRDPEKRYARTRMRHPKTGEPLIYSNNVAYDPAHQVAFIRLFYERPQGPQSGAEREMLVHLAHRQFFPQELAALFHYNGFRIERHDGGFDGEPLSDASTEQVICARVR